MTHPLDPQDWHAWFTHQAGWTHQTRQWLYQQVHLDQAGSILEVGCGTGVIVEEIAGLAQGHVVGLDIDSGMLTQATAALHRAGYIRGDAHTLPFPDEAFDIIICHYLLLWLHDPAQALEEMARVVRPGGWVLACAEPDYGGRIDQPPALARMGQLQREALRRQAANPECGRYLAAWFNAAGLRTTCGLIPGQWQTREPDADFEAEWRMREHDLAGLLDAEEMARLKQIDRQALHEGTRLLFVPTFYAFGQKGE